MIVWGLEQIKDVKESARQAGVQAVIVRKGKDGDKWWAEVKLKPRGSRYRFSYKGIEFRDVCFHGYARFFAILFAKCEVVVDTPYGIITKENFSQIIATLRYRSIGGIDDYIPYCSCCECGDGD